MGASSEQRPRRHLRIFVWGMSASIALVLGIYFGPQTITYCGLRPSILRAPDVPPRGWRSVPRPLADNRVSAAEGTALSYYGYRFEVPWKEIDKEWNEGSSVKVLFKSGQVIRFNNPEFFDWDPINSFAGQVDQDDFRLAFGPASLESKYDQFKAVVSTAPSQLSPLRSHKEFARIRTLLEVKRLWFEHLVGMPEILSFETADYRGFEVSGLSHDWQNVVLHLFDRSDQHWLALNIYCDAHCGLGLTQPEINRVIQSFGPALSSQQRARRSASGKP